MLARQAAPPGAAWAALQQPPGSVGLSCSSCSAAVPVVLASHPRPPAPTHEALDFLLEQGLQAGSDCPKEKGTKVGLNLILGGPFEVGTVGHGEPHGSPAKGRPFGFGFTEELHSRFRLKRLHELHTLRDTTPSSRLDPRLRSDAGLIA